ncbi:hypothetical protein [Enterobacter roggenkampii]|nr:hypothetical protein [Enterobacter roggenkampii]HDS4388952.1 hypothetical protein [Enterobacter roggenkampii]HDT2108553.1 hypothetical protein [Enterobacter roggenkampii]
MDIDNSPTTPQKAKTHETTVPLLKAMYQEFKEISKKKLNQPLAKVS